MGCVTSEHPFLHTSTAYAHPQIRYTIHCFVHLTQICQTLKNTTKALSGYVAAPSHLLLFSAVQIARLVPLAALAAVHHGPRTYLLAHLTHHGLARCPRPIPPQPGR